MFRIFLNQEGQSITTVLIGLDYFEAKLVHRQQTAKDPAAHFFHGTKPGMVDYMIWPWCERADLMTILAQRKVFELDSTRYPALVRVIKTC